MAWVVLPDIKWGVTWERQLVVREGKRREEKKEAGRGEGRKRRGKRFLRSGENVEEKDG